MRRECEQESHRLEPCNRSEHFIEVNARLLHVPLCHESCLVLHDGTTRVPLLREHPLQADWAVATRRIDETPCTVLLDGVHLLAHRTLPLGCFLSLGKRARFLGSPEMELAVVKDVVREPHVRPDNALPGSYHHRVRRHVCPGSLSGCNECPGTVSGCGECPGRLSGCGE